jgi:hypothetical protein
MPIRVIVLNGRSFSLSCRYIQLDSEILAILLQCRVNIFEESFRLYCQMNIWMVRFGQAAGDALML